MPARGFFSHGGDEAFVMRDAALSSSRSSAMFETGADDEPDVIANQRDITIHAEVAALDRTAGQQPRGVWRALFIVRCFPLLNSAKPTCRGRDGDFTAGCGKGRHFGPSVPLAIVSTRIMVAKRHDDREDCILCSARAKRGQRCAGVPVSRLAAERTGTQAGRAGCRAVLQAFI